jgi:hypothetical protein
MPATYDPIATQTLGYTAGSVTFSSIPSTYTDLVFVVNASQAGINPVYIQVNGLTTAIYSNTWMVGNGSTASSGRYTAAALGGAGFNLDNFNSNTPFPTTFSGIGTYHFMNYSNTTTNKTVLLRHGNNNWTVADVGLIATTAAISSITCYAVGNNWNSGSIFSLYGIKAA